MGSPEEVLAARRVKSSLNLAGNKDKFMVESSKMRVVRSLDASGLVCPEPLMLVRAELRTMDSGELLSITATDPSTSRDLNNFCRFMGHSLESESSDNAIWVFVLRKG